MSSQEKTPVLKIASHARLQEVEESWISSEELRTDGSSDEESKQKNKVTKVKQTKKARGVAHMKRKEEISRDDAHKCKLPPIAAVKSSNVTGIKSKTIAKCNDDDNDEDDDYVQGAKSFDYTKACSSNYYAKRKSLQESIHRSHEIDVLWRPKRGSITLPVGPDGAEKSLRLIALEMNDFYLEMSDKLVELKTVDKRKPENVEVTRADSERTLMNDPELRASFVNIKELDRRLNEFDSLLNDVKKDRMLYQERICGEIKEAFSDENAKKFLNVFQGPATDDEENNIAEVRAPLLTKRNKSKEKNYKKDFLKRNIQLAKEPHTMASLCLTDEEKLNLTALLADLEDSKQRHSANDFPTTGKPKEESCNRECGDIEIECSTKEAPNDSGGFRFSQEEQNKLLELEKKLTILLQTDASDAASRPNAEDVDLLNDKDGKYWKHQLLVDRLKEIDCEIYLIQKAKLDEIRNKLNDEDDVHSDEIADVAIVKNERQLVSDEEKEESDNGEETDDSSDSIDDDEEEDDDDDDE